MMLFPEKMLYLKIKIPKDDIDRAIVRIGRTSLLHIDERKGKRLYLEEERRVLYLLNLCKKYMDILNIKAPPIITVSQALTLDKLEEIILSAGAEIDRFSNKQKELERKIRLMERGEEVKNALKKDIDVETLIKKLKFIKLAIGILPSENFPSVEMSIRRIQGFFVYNEITEGSLAMAVFYTDGMSSSVERIFSKNQVQIIPGEYLMEEKRKQLERELEKVEGERKKLAEIYGRDLIQGYAFLETLAKMVKAKEHLDVEGDFFVLYGWIPAGKKEEFLRAIGELTVEILPAGEDAPVLLKTPRIFKPFERLIQGFSYPRYGEINPTIPFAITFLLLFGIMFGDVGHGALLSMAGYILKKKYRDLGEVLILSGLSAVFFGFMYGSFFGFHGIFPTLLFHPLEDIDQILIFSVAVGIIVITAGFLLNMFSLLKRKKISALLTGEGGLLWFLIYWYSIGIGIKGVVFQLDIKYDLLILAVLIGLSFWFVYRRTKNITGSIIDTFRELLEYFTNTVSFIRLGAFALAHSALFLAVFTIARLIETKPAGGVLYWVVIVLGNIFIVVLEGVIVAIQTLRLEYYEFFKRFFKGGGVPYTPFSIP